MLACLTRADQGTIGEHVCHLASLVQGRSGCWPVTQALIKARKVKTSATMPRRCKGVKGSRPA